MNKARPKRVGPTCGCCDLLMAPRAFRKYGPPTKRAIAEQVAEYEPEYDAAMARLDDYEFELRLDPYDTCPSWYRWEWSDEENALATIVGPDFEIVGAHELS